MLYSAFTYYCGFKVNSGEYKLMGLAPYGEPKHVDLILDKLIDLKDDGSFRMDMSYFNYCQGLTMTSKKFDQLFGGPPRQPETLLTQRDMDMAASIQVVTEEILLRMARHVHAETGQKKLCLAGGVALNCVANGRILREGPFEDLWIQPAAGDAGERSASRSSSGTSCSTNPRQPQPHDAQRGSYLGPQFSDDEIRGFLDGVGAKLPLLRKGRRALRRRRRTDRRTKKSSAGCRDGWSSAPARWAPAAFWATPAASRCSRR